jgi:hypothetical protein
MDDAPPPGQPPPQAPITCILGILLLTFIFFCGWALWVAANFSMGLDSIMLLLDCSVIMRNRF